MAAQIATRSKGPRLTKAQDVEHAKTHKTRFGMWHPEALALAAATPVTVADALAETRARSAEIGATLRNVPGGQAPARRPAAKERAAARVAAAFERANAKTPAAPAAAPAPFRPSYAEVDAMLAKIPVGRYALPRNEASSAGNTVTFFEVRKVHGQHRITQLVGGVGDYTRQPLKLHLQFFAAKHILADVPAAAKLYGDKNAACGFCAAQGRYSPLTNTRSIAAGYGETCAKKHGMPY